MSSKIQTYAELQKMIRKTLREQHPEWIDAHGKCTLCDSYEARFAKLLRIFPDMQLARRSLRIRSSRNNRKQARNLRNAIAVVKRKFHVGILGGACNADGSPEVFNLGRVLFEIMEDYDQAERYNGQAIRLNKNYEPAQQNTWRIYELFQFGSSKEPFNLGKANVLFRLVLVLGISFGRRRPRHISPA